MNISNCERRVHDGRWVLAAFLALVSGCGDSGNLTKVFGSAKAIDSVKRATRVDAFRLPPKSYGQPKLSDYEMSAGPIAIPDSRIEQLRSALLSEGSYGWDFSKGCEPDYGVRVQFQNGSDNVDVLFCFGCDILTVYHNGKRVGSEDFDPARSRFVEVFQAIFPADGAIQGLD